MSIRNLVQTISTFMGKALKIRSDGQGREEALQPDFFLTTRRLGPDLGPITEPDDAIM